MENNNYVRIERQLLENFCEEVFVHVGLSQTQARDSATILVAADARGITSHGVARLWRYCNGLQKGIMKINPNPLILRETPLSVVIDADGAMGMSISKQTMNKVILKAKQTGVGFSSVRNSNHFGIAGYYSEMAAHQDMIGIAMTNTAALGVPTFGSTAMFGTNPFSVSVPSTSGRIFTLDMATTGTTRGKVEVYTREGMPLPEGWAVDTNGKVTSDGAQLLQDMLFQRGGGLLPLGGDSELFGGHKGYGLAVLVDIFSAVASGGDFADSVVDSEATSARVCHFFGAIRLDLFRDIEAFKQDMNKLLEKLNSCKTAKGSSKVYYAGQKEHENEIENTRLGIPISMNVLTQLIEIGENFEVTIRLTPKRGVSEFNK